MPSPDTRPLHPRPELAAAVERLAPSVLGVLAHRRGFAAGCVWKPGVVVTTASAVWRAHKPRLVRPDGEHLAAELRGVDGETDLAVLGFEGAESPVAERAVDAAPRVGDFVFAAGREPSGLLHASFGHVGAAGPAWRSGRGGRIDALIRLDGGLFAGLEGAPVADAGGQVIGIASSAFSRRHAVVLPVATVDRIVAALLAHGRIARGYLGVAAQTVRLAEPLRQALDHAGEEGLLIAAVADGGPAAAAGLMVGDIVLAAGGRAVASIDALRELLGSEQIGARLRLRVARGGQPLELSLAVAERPAGRCG